MTHRTLCPVEPSEYVAAFRTEAARSGHAAVLVGAAGWQEDGRRHPQTLFVPYLRVCPSAYKVYQMDDRGGRPGLVSFLRAILDSRDGDKPLPDRAQAMRWNDLEERAADGRPLSVGWADADGGLDATMQLERFMADGSPWRENLRRLASRAPLALYLAPVERRLRKELRMRLPRHTVDAVVRAALPGLLVAAGDSKRASPDDDALLSKVHALEQAKARIGRRRFRKRPGDALGSPELLAMALHALDVGLPPDWWRGGAQSRAASEAIRTAKRKLSAPFGTAGQWLSASWSVPLAVPFFDEPFFCRPEPLAIAWELARWTRTRSFLHKRWVLGGGAHVVATPSGARQTTFLAEPFHYLGGAREGGALKMTGALRELLLLRPARTLDELAVLASEPPATARGTAPPTPARQLARALASLYRDAPARFGGAFRYGRPLLRLEGP